MERGAGRQVTGGTLVGSCWTPMHPSLQVASNLQSEMRLSNSSPRCLFHLWTCISSTRVYMLKSDQIDKQVLKAFSTPAKSVKRTTAQLIPYVSSLNV